MPLFIDHHKNLPPMPPEAVEKMWRGIQDSRATSEGAKGVNIFLGKEGQAWCLSESPNAEAVAKAHNN